MNPHGRTPPTGSQVTIHEGRMYWPGREAPAWRLADGPSWVERLRDNTVLLTVFLYLLFNWGFQQLRFPPVAGGGLPLGEIVLVLALLTINYTRTLGRMSQVVYLLPFMIWWGFGLSRALADASIHGFWALRDAAHVIESLFLVVGFVFAAYPSTLEKFFRWLPRLLIVTVAYSLLFPFPELTWSLSPKIVAGNGLVVAVFGSMSNTAYLLIMAAAYLLLFHGRRPLANVVAVLLLGYTVVMFQARTLYLVIIGVFGLIALYRRGTVGNLGLMVYTSGLLLALMALFGLEVQGRLGATFSVDFLVDHFLAIFGISSTEYQGVAAAARGLDQRLQWWTEIVWRLFSDPFYMLLGLGYGTPLTDFYGHGGVEVREPHNSYVTILARTGVVGLVAWVAMMLSLLRCWHRAFRRAAAVGWREGESRLLLLMTFFISMWILALGEDGFEKPYNIVPFYFLWGVVLRMGLMLERGTIGPEAEREERDED